MMTQDLGGGGWTVRAVNDLSGVPEAVRGKDVPATVPGCAHTDLMSAGLLEDPYLFDNELRQFWVGRTDWQYRRSFSLSAEALSAEHLELVCEGLDTLAAVKVNGVLVGESANMHVTSRFDLKKAAKPGANELEITFTAPMPLAEHLEEKVYPGLPHTGHGSNKPRPHNMLRKMSCNMGWDWGPDVATSGIWRPIRIEAWAAARIDYVRPSITEATEKRARVEVNVDVVRSASGKGTVKAELVSPAGQSYQAKSAKGDQFLFEVEKPERWWPVGHGAQPLYELRVSLSDEKGAQIDQWSGRIGLRTLALDLTPDAGDVSDPVPDKRGSRMTVRVNGKAIYCKGANWIPDDCFPHRVTPAQYRVRIEQALHANMNMLRVWGGGIYEDDAFYNTCDELGIMVWQDFLFACACYPEEPAYKNLVIPEIRQNVSRLCHHASLVLWNGCNENIVGTFDWGPEWIAIRTEGKRPWGLGYYFEVIPNALRQLDPSRPYWPASPYSGSMDIHPNDNEHGNRHIWDVWHGPGQYRNYLTHYPRLATEFGYHGPAAYATVARAIAPQDRTWDSAVMQLHNKNGNPGQIQTNTRMADDFVPPVENYDSWHFLAQIMQARALSMGIEWFRALSPWNSGALYWQFNDCYPVSSWSAIDGDGREKPLFHASRRFFAPRLVTIKPRRVVKSVADIGPLAVYLHNDTDETWGGTCSIKQMSLEGKVLQEVTVQVNVAPRLVHRIEVPDEMIQNRSAFLLAEVGNDRGFWWFAPDKELAYPPVKLRAELHQMGDLYRLTVSSDASVIRDLCLFPDRLDPLSVVSDNCVTLVPGDKFEFMFRSSKDLKLEDVTKAPVLNCANFFGKK